MKKSKPINEMNKDELEQYQHRPETELAILVCRAKEKGEYAELKDYLQVELQPWQHCTCFNL